MALGCSPAHPSTQRNTSPQVAGLLAVQPNPNHRVGPTAQAPRLGPLTLTKVSGDGVVQIGSRTTLTVELRDGNSGTVPGAQVSFYGYCNGLGTATTDVNGRASVAAVPYLAQKVKIDAYAVTTSLASNLVQFEVEGQ